MNGVRSLKGRVRFMVDIADIRAVIDMPVAHAPPGPGGPGEAEFESQDKNVVEDPTRQPET